ncbi:MAG: S-layer homology domain-containing protein [Deltaproteobacteria bacterium]
MKSMKKSLAFLVVFAMVLSCVAPVFAATPTDVAGTDYEAAVGNLVSLGVISGYEDGTYKPEQNITRAEFAKIVCSMLRLQPAGTVSKFKDVKADNWAVGYINAAAGKGLISGYPDKTFKPEANITYAEAITILVRALGMGEYVDLQKGGTWPGNYLAAGSMAGITNDVAGFSATNTAVRGTIAQLAWNTLGAKSWGPTEITSAGIVYGRTDKTLMEDLYKNYVFKNSDDKYEIKWFEDVKVIGTYTTGLIEADQIKIDVTNESELHDMAKSTEVVNTVDQGLFDVAEGINTITLYGLKVDILLGKDNKIMNIRVATPAKDRVKGFLGEVNADDKLIIKAKKTDDSDVGTKYTIANDAIMFINSLPVASNRADIKTAVNNAIGNSNASVDAIIESGSIQTIKVTIADLVAPAAVAAYKAIAAPRDHLHNWKQFVVAEITKNNVVKNVANPRATMFDLDDLSNTDKYIIIKNGKPATKADIKVGDAVSYFEKSDFTYILVSDVKVTGKVERNQSGDNNNLGGTTRKLTVGGNLYTMALDGSAAYTKNNSIEEEDIKAVAGDDMKDFYNKDVTITLNALGDIVFVSGSVTASSANMQIGVIKKVASSEGSDYSVKILGQDGIVKPYTVKSGKIKFAQAIGGHGAAYTGDYQDLDADANKAEIDDVYDHLVPGTLVMFEVASDSKIDASDFYVLAAPNTEIAGTSYYGDLYISAQTGHVQAVKDSSKKITNDGGTSFYFKAATSILNSLAANVESVDNWDSIVSADFTAVPSANTILDDATALHFVYDNDDKSLKSIIINNAKATYITTEYKYGIYLSDERQDDPIVKLFLATGEKTYTVDGSVYNDHEINKGDLFAFKVTGESKFTDDSLKFSVKDAKKIVDDGLDAADYYKIKKSFETENRTITFQEACKRANNAVESSATLATDVVVYDCRGTEPKIGSVSDLKAGVYVWTEDYTVADQDYGVVVIFAGE